MGRSDEFGVGGGGHDPQAHPHWPLTKPKFKQEDKALQAARKELKGLLMKHPREVNKPVYNKPSGYALRQHHKDIEDNARFIKIREKGHKQAGYEPR